MRFAEKFLFAASIARTAYGKWRLQQILAGVAIIVSLAVLAAVMVGALVVGLMFTAYIALIGSGVHPLIAMAAILCFVALIILALAMSIKRRVYRFKRVVNTPVGEVADAFLSGLMGKTK